MGAEAQHTNTVSAVFHLNNKEAKRDLKVDVVKETLPFCSETETLGVTLDRLLTYRRHLEFLRKNSTSRVALLMRLAGSGWGVVVTTLRIVTLAWSIPQQSTALLYGAAVFIPASLTLPSTTPCDL